MPLQFPLIQGIDIAGEVVEVEVGDGVDGAWIGRRVIVDPVARYEGEYPAEIAGSEVDGGFSQFHLCHQRQPHDATSSPLSQLQLACLPTAYGTALGMLNRADCAPGERVLVTGSSGGVGMAALQLLVDRGCSVIARTSASKRDFIAGLGVAFDIRRRYLHHRRLIGSTMHTATDFAELATIAVAGGVDPVVAETYPLTEIAAAQTRFNQKDFTGKLVLEP